MLTAEHVHVRRHGDELHLVKLDSRRRARGMELAEVYAGLFRAHVGEPRQVLQDACDAIPVSPSDKRLAAGLVKLLTDRAVFEEESVQDPVALRDALFAAAAETRRRLQPGEHFDRNAALHAYAAQNQTTAQDAERSLFADLPGAHLLREVSAPTPERLMDLYELGQAQAILLRATRIVADVESKHPEDYRNLFRKLKFHQLLFSIHENGSGYRLEIDGPLSLFESATRYGLRLAMTLPALLNCGRHDIRASLRWGKTRTELSFRITGNAAGRTDISSTTVESDPIRELFDRINNAAGPWSAVDTSRILNLPGVGLCVPDFELQHRSSGKSVFFEQLGYWSRAAVWKRVELVQHGLPFPIVFGVPRQLRVSAEVLDEALPASLYVFPRIPSMKGLLEHAEAVLGRQG